MSEAAEGAAPPPPAWQPLTFGGVAAFARRGWGCCWRSIWRGYDGRGVPPSGFSIAIIALSFLQAIQKMPETARVAEGQSKACPAV